MFTNQHHLRHLLRPEHYRSAEQHALELRELFLPAWHPVATVAQFRRPGDFITLDLFGQPILMRNMDGEICAFLNVCPHRHSRLTSQVRGNTDRLRCQYHGWEYKADGTTGQIPDARAFRPWDRENSCLRKYRVAAWGEMVFLSLQHEGVTLRDFLAPIEDEWGKAFEPPFRFVAAWHGDFPCNWKVVLENSLESYHIPQVHPKTFKVYPEEEVCAHVLNPRYTTFRTRIPNDWVTRRMNGLVKRLGMSATSTYEHVNIHPHVTMSRLDVYRMVQCVYPTGPKTCRYFSFLFSLRGPKRNPWAWLQYRGLRAIVASTARKIFREDASIYAAIQQGLESSPFPGVIGTREERVHAFQQFVLEKCGSPALRDE